MDISKITILSSSFKGLFEKITEFAKENGFVQRLSKLTANRMIKAVIQAQLQYKTPSLRNYSETFEESSGNKISASGFDKRINTKSVEILKEYLSGLLSFCMCGVNWIPKLLQKFTNVYLLDSTIIQLPEALKEIYKGFSGCGSKAAIKVQCLYNVFAGMYEHFGITAASNPDQTYGIKTTSLLAQGSLILFDLGYVTLDFLKSIIQSGCFFVCRFADYRFKLYEPDNCKNEINLLSILKKNKGKIVEITALINRKSKIPCRIIAFPLDKSVVEQRKQEAKTFARHKGRGLTKKHLDFMNWSIVCTNADQSLIKTRDAYRIYRLRWRIELIFKLWKSQLDLDYLSGQRITRIEFELYSKLITLTFFSLITTQSSSDFYEKIEISEIVCIETFRKLSKRFLQSYEEPNLFNKTMLFYSHKISSFGLKTKSKNKKSTFDLLNKHAKGGHFILRINTFNINDLIYNFLHPPPLKPKSDKIKRKSRHKIVSKSTMSYKQYMELKKQKMAC